MPRAALTATHTRRTGRVMVAEANGNVTDGHTVPNSGNTKILVRNSSVDTPYDVTIHVRKSVDGHEVAEQITEIPATQSWIFGPYDRDNYGEDLWINVENAALKIQVIEG